MNILSFIPYAVPVQPDGGNGTYSMRIRNHVRHRSDLRNLLPILKTSLDSIQFIHEGNSAREYVPPVVLPVCQWCAKEIDESGWAQINIRYLKRFEPDEWDDEPYEVMVSLFWHRVCARRQRDLLSQALGLEITREMLGWSDNA